MGILVFYPFVVDVRTRDALASMGQEIETASTSIYPVIMYVLGGVAMKIFLSRHYADVRRWFPVKIKKNK